MQRLLSILTAFLLCPFFYSQGFKDRPSTYSFYENKGQIVDQDGNPNANVLYLFNSNGLNVQLKKNGFSYDFYETKEIKDLNSKVEQSDLPKPDSFNENQFDVERLFHRIDIEFINCNQNVELSAEDRSPDYENYYNLQHKPDGVTNVHRYNKVIYKNLYQNIDLVFFKPEDVSKPIEYNFIIRPGGKISDIKMKFSGAKTHLKDGKLMMNVRFGEAYEDIPSSWIEGHKKSLIDVNFKEIESQIYGFKAPIDSSDKTIVIDPVPTRIWGSYLGGNGDEGFRLKTDSQNTLYAFGTTNSTNNIATTGAYQVTNAGFADAFICKITSDGQKLWGTYYGNLYSDKGYDIDFSPNLDIYFTGTYKVQIPGYTSQYYVYNQLFLLKLNPTGQLVFDNIMGGNGIDTPHSISYSNLGISIVGETTSDNLPCINTLQTIKKSPSGYSDAFVMRFDFAGSFQWCTYLGGTDGSTTLYDILDSNNDLELIGITRSNQIPMVNPIQGNNAGITDILYVRLSSDGTQILKSSYFGLDGQDVTYHARIINNILILPGKYFSPTQNIISVGLYKVNLLNNAISKTYFSAYNSFQDQFYIDADGNFFLTGLADVGQTGLTTPNAYMTNTGPFIKSYLVKININNQIEWGTFYGGNGATQQSSVTKDASGYIYLGGMSSNNTTGIATPGTFQQLQGSSNDGYIAKFLDCGSNGAISSNAPICNGTNLQLNANGGDSYSWTGPNGFSSTLQNPTIPNATSVNSGTYTCTIISNSGCNGTFSISVFVGDNSPPVPDMATLPTISGNCNTLVSTIPTATDNCSGSITGTTNSPLSYSVPGTYTVQWNYNDGNGNSTTQNQTVIVVPETPPTGTSPQSFCAIDQPALANIAVTGSNIKWYDAIGNLLPNSTTLVDGTTYYASQTVNGCESSKTGIAVNIADPAPPTGSTLQTFCPSQNPTLSSLVVNGQNIKWYDSTGNILAPNSAVTNGQTYHATQTINGCESTQNLAITVDISNNGVPATDYYTTICNATVANTMIINLSDYNGNIIINPTLYTFEYFDQANQVISNFSNYTISLGSNIFSVKVIDSNGCSKIVTLSIFLNPIPDITLNNQEFCKGTFATLDAGPGYESYLWSTGETTSSINVDQTGIYSVTVSYEGGCSNTAEASVTEIIVGSITGVEITDHKVTVNVSPAGEYLYSIDNINWQGENIFNNLEIGKYVVYVKTRNGCLVGVFPFTIFQIPNTITPNHDKINDTWVAEGFENHNNSEVSVYDRYGKMVYNKILHDEINWDGTFLNQPLPTGTYWYVIKVTDGRLYKGFLFIKNTE